MKATLLTLLKRSIWIGIIITILSPFLFKYKVTDLRQFSDLRFGFPFGFISQQSWLTPFEEDLPAKVHIGLPQENPTKIICENFVLSLITITAAVFFIGIIWSLFIKLIFRFRKS
jgi:hypothetical protein